MEYVIIIVFWVQAQGWSVATAEFADQGACESARIIATEAFQETSRKAPGGATAGRAHCLPKHSPKS